MPPEVNWDMIVTIQVLEEMMQVFMKIIIWIVKLTPFALVSLIAAAVGAQTDVGEVFQQIGYLVAAVCVGLLLQYLIVGVLQYLRHCSEKESFQVSQTLDSCMDVGICIFEQRCHHSS